MNRNRYIIKYIEEIQKAYKAKLLHIFEHLNLYNIAPYVMIQRKKKLSSVNVHYRESKT